MQSAYSRTTADIDLRVTNGASKRQTGKHTTVSPLEVPVSSFVTKLIIESWTPPGGTR